MRPQDRLETIAPPDRLDQAWAATRPAEPSPAVLDALWAHASAELDRIEAARLGDVVPLIDRRTARRRRALAGMALAQAAALLVAAGVAWHHRAGDPARPVVAVVPPRIPGVVVDAPARPMVEVEVDKILVVRIDNGLEEVVQVPMLPPMADNSHHDFFNAMESASIP